MPGNAWRLWMRQTQHAGIDPEPLSLRCFAGLADGQVRQTCAKRRHRLLWVARRVANSNMTMPAAACTVTAPRLRRALPSKPQTPKGGDSKASVETFSLMLRGRQWLHFIVVTRILGIGGVPPKTCSPNFLARVQARSSCEASVPLRRPRRRWKQWWLP